jgi:hypothetical protein
MSSTAKKSRSGLYGSPRSGSRSSGNSSRSSGKSGLRRHVRPASGGPLYPPTRRTVTQVEVEPAQRMRLPGHWKWNCEPANAPGADVCSLELSRPTVDAFTVKSTTSAALPTIVATGSHIEGALIRTGIVQKSASVPIPQGSAAVYNFVNQPVYNRGPGTPLTDVTLVAAARAAGSNPAVPSSARDKKEDKKEAEKKGGNAPIQIAHAMGDGFVSPASDPSNLSLRVFEHVADEYKNLLQSNKASRAECEIKDGKMECRAPIAFVELSNFGRRSVDYRNGFPFPERYWPTECYGWAIYKDRLGSDQYPAYREWLISVLVKLRRKHDDLVGPIFADEQLATVAILEQRLLATLGVFEIQFHGELIVRAQVFAGAKPFFPIMDEVLLEYITKKTEGDLWFSPLRTRHLFAQQRNAPDLHASMSLTEFIIDLTGPCGENNDKKVDMQKAAQNNVGHKALVFNALKKDLESVYTSMRNSFPSLTDKKLLAAATKAGEKGEDGADQLTILPVGILESILLSAVARVQMTRGIGIYLAGNSETNMTKSVKMQSYYPDKVAKYGDKLADANPSEPTEPKNNVIMHLNPTLQSYFDIMTENALANEDKEQDANKGKNLQDELKSIGLIDLVGVKQLLAIRAFSEIARQKGQMQTLGELINRARANGVTLTEDELKNELQYLQIRTPETDALALLLGDQPAKRYSFDQKFYLPNRGTDSRTFLQQHFATLNSALDDGTGTGADTGANASRIGLKTDYTDKENPAMPQLLFGPMPSQQ